MEQQRGDGKNGRFGSCYYAFQFSSAARIKFEKTMPFGPNNPNNPNPIFRGKGNGMKLEEALRSGKRFRRRNEGWCEADSGRRYDRSDVLADDWEIEREPREFYIWLDESGAPVVTGLPGEWGPMSVVRYSGTLPNTVPIKVREVLE